MADDDYDDDDYGDDYDDDDEAAAEPLPSTPPPPQQTSSPPKQVATAESDDLFLPLIMVNKRNPAPVNREHQADAVGNLDPRIKNTHNIRYSESGKRSWRTAPLDRHMPMGSTLSRNGLFTLKTTGRSRNTLVQGRGKRGFGMPPLTNRTLDGPDPYYLSGRQNLWRQGKQGKASQSRLRFADERSNPRWQPLTKSEREYEDRLRTDGLNGAAKNSSNMLIGNGDPDTDKHDSSFDHLSKDLAQAIRNSSKAKELSSSDAEEGILQLQMIVVVPSKIPDSGVIKVRTPAGRLVEIVLPGPKKSIYAGSKLVKPYTCAIDSKGLPVHLKKAQRFRTGKGSDQKKKLAILKDKMEGIVAGVHIESRNSQALFKLGNPHPQGMPKRPKATLNGGLPATTRPANGGCSLKTSEDTATATPQTMDPTKDDEVRSATTTGGDGKEDKQEKGEDGGYSEDETYSEDDGYDGEFD